jgi:hypothetical protein
MLDGLAHLMKKGFTYRFSSGASLARDAAHGLSH